MSFTPDQIASSPDLYAHLRLCRTDGIGPVSFSRLVSRHGSATEAVAMLEAAAKKGTAKTALASPDKIDEELEAAKALQASFLFLGHQDYPSLLSELSDAPAVLTIKGNIDCLSKTTIGVVGARNCSAGGAKITRKICQALGTHNFTIVSGLARGIDTAAHSASAETGTIACMAGGLDIIYPPENADLYEAILASGLIVSEMPLGTKPLARHFPRRNRIISGLSRGLVIVEAAQRSGSLITAGYAADQNRDVFAVPGSPLDPRAQGSNKLIRDGAVLVQSGVDIISEYETMPLLRSVQSNGPTKGRPQEKPPMAAPGPDTRPSTSKILPTSEILTLLSPAPIHIDELVRVSGIPANTLLSEFTELEVLGEVIRHAGGKYSRISIKNE